MQTTSGCGILAIGRNTLVDSVPKLVSAVEWRRPDTETIWPLASRRHSSRLTGFVFAMTCVGLSRRRFPTTILVGADFLQLLISMTRPYASNSVVLYFLRNFSLLSSGSLRANEPDGSRYENM